MKRNQSFCYAPWVHMYTNPDNKLLPCCLFDDNNQDFPDLNTTSLESAINHPRMIELRKEFIEGKIPAGCYKCEEQLKTNTTPYREKMNNYGKNKQIVINTDGTLELLNFNPTFLDIRFGNLCNLKCRTCSPTFSSSIGAEKNKIYNLKMQVLYKLDNNIVDQIFSKLEYVEHLYLAGGEPLIEEKNYILLHELIKRKLTPSLLYNTNLTNISFKDEIIIDLWKNFTDVRLIVSLDGYKEVNDYIRHGSQYDEILQNIQKIKNEAPHVKFTVNSVASIMSMHSLPDVWKDILLKKICGPEDILFSICYYPVEFNPTVLTIESKKEVQELFNKFIKWLHQHYSTKNAMPLIKKCLGLIEYMLSKDNSHLIIESKQTLSVQDNFRKTDFSKILNI